MMNYFYQITLMLGLLSLCVTAQNANEENKGDIPAQVESTIEEQKSKAIDQTTSNPDAEEVIVVEPSLFDKREILRLDQIARIKEVQKDFLDKHQCIVSYGFYDGHLSNISVRQSWKDMVAKDEAKQFHLFINIGVFIKNTNVEIDYRYPPALKDSQEINTILANLNRDLTSEVGLDALLDRSYEAVNDELTYLKNKPVYESKVQDEVNAFEADQLKIYLIKIGKIIGFVLVPLIALFVIWSIFTNIRNKKSYRFPDVQYIARLGSNYSATSISKIKK